MKTNRRKFVKTGIASVAGVALAGKTIANVLAAEFTTSQTIALDGPDWRIATDPDNKGRDGKWFSAPRPEAKPTTVPCTMQEIFPGSSGLAWYWKEFTAPANPHAGGRCLLRFWAVDYKADVWLNGKPVGTHLDAEEPFTLDATEAIRPGNNLLAVRVLNPADKPIDGLTRGFIHIPPYQFGVLRHCICDRRIWKDRKSVV
jgi:hypothetical protein